MESKAIAQTTNPVTNRTRSLISKALGVKTSLEPSLLENLVNVIAAELEQAETTALNALAACAELRDVLETPAENGLPDSCGHCSGTLDDHYDWCPAGRALTKTDLGKGWISPHVAAKLRTALEQFADGNSWDWIDEFPCWEGKDIPWEIAQEALEGSVSGEEGA